MIPLEIAGLHVDFLTEENIDGVFDSLSAIEQKCFLRDAEFTFAEGVELVNLQTGEKLEVDPHPEAGRRVVRAWFKRRSSRGTPPSMR